MINLASFYIIIEISCARRTILTACRRAGAYGTSHGTVAARGEPSPFVTFSLFAPIPLLALKSTLASGSPAAAAFFCAGLSVVPGDASAVLTNRPRLVVPWPKPASTALDTGALLRLRPSRRLGPTHTTVRAPLWLPSKMYVQRRWRRVKKSVGKERYCPIARFD
jgi:hypothetical protein